MHITLSHSTLFFNLVYAPGANGNTGGCFCFVRKAPVLSGPFQSAFK